MLTGDRDVAQDLAHDAFVKIGGKVLALRDADHARAYLFRTVINLCRGRGRAASVVFAEFQVDPGLSATPGEWLVEIEARLGHRPGWTPLAKFALAITDKVLGADGFIAFANEVG